MLAAEIVNPALGGEPGAQGPTNARPPFVPVPFSVLAGMDRGPALLGSRSEPPRSTQPTWNAARCSRTSGSGSGRGTSPSMAILGQPHRDAVVEHHPVEPEHEPVADASRRRGSISGSCTSGPGRRRRPVPRPRSCRASRRPGRRRRCAPRGTRARRRCPDLRHARGSTSAGAIARRSRTPRRVPGGCVDRGGSFGSSSAGRGPCRRAPRTAPARTAAARSSGPARPAPSRARRSRSRRSTRRSCVLGRSRCRCRSRFTCSTLRKPPPTASRTSARSGRAAGRRSASRGRPLVCTSTARRAGDLRRRPLRRPEPVGPVPSGA